MKLKIKSQNILKKINENNKIVYERKFKTKEQALWQLIPSCVKLYRRKWLEDITINEVNKIMLYYNEPCYIKNKDVENIISKSINTNNFLFVDAVVDNNLEKSLELYQDLKIMKVEPSVLIALLVRDYRIMLNIKTMLQENKREYEIMNEVGLLDWQFDKYLNKIFPYKIKELESIILKLSDLDYNIKSGKIDRYIGLELFILDMCE